ncbi:MAG: hypothetical protein AAFU80_12455 [Pseudomonadota bacterium]
MARPWPLILVLTGLTVLPACERREVLEASVTKDPPSCDAGPFFDGLRRIQPAVGPVAARAKQEEDLRRLAAALHGADLEDGCTFSAISTSYQVPSVIGSPEILAGANAVRFIARKDGTRICTDVWGDPVNRTMGSDDRPWIWEEIPRLIRSPGSSETEEFKRYLSPCFLSDGQLEGYGDPMIPARVLLSPAYRRVPIAHGSRIETDAP